jgi:shikimate dehydrogenase
MITAETRLYGILGDPIEGSLSPEIHNSLFSQHQINGSYLAFNVSKAKLKNAVLGVKALGMDGINITIPHKEKILDYLDGLDLKAYQIGAVNMVKRVDDQLIGYNTDIVGFMRAFKEHFGENLKGKKGVVLGAGGSARALVYGLLEEGLTSIYLFNRKLPRANRMIENLSVNFKEVEIETHPLTEVALKKIISQGDFLINSLPEIAIKQNPWILLSLEKASPTMGLYDLNYKIKTSQNTSLVKEAVRLKLKAYNGLSMLAAQAVESFYIWTGKKADWKELIKMLNSKL